MYVVCGHKKQHFLLYFSDFIGIKTLNETKYISLTVGQYIGAKKPGAWAWKIRYWESLA